MLYTKEAPYIYSREGIFYFTRRIPKDLNKHYRCLRITLSLRTRSENAARTKSLTLAAQLNEEWFTLRWRQKDNPLGRFLINNEDVDQLPSNAPLLSEAKEIYVSAKGSGRQIAFQHAAQRAINNLIVLAGDKPIDRYSRVNVNQVRDQLFERGLSRSSIKRILGTIRAIVNFAVKEHGLPSISALK